MSKFKVGDQVVVIDTSEWRAVKLGMVGVIRSKSVGGMFGIDFGPGYNLHDLQGSISTKTGFFLHEKNLDYAKNHYVKQFINETLA